MDQTILEEIQKKMSEVSKNFSTAYDSEIDNQISWLKIFQYVILLWFAIFVIKFSWNISDLSKQIDYIQSYTSWNYENISYLQNRIDDLKQNDANQVDNFDYTIKEMSWDIRNIKYNIATMKSDIRSAQYWCEEWEIALVYNTYDSDKVKDWKYKTRVGYVDREWYDSVDIYTNNKYTNKVICSDSTDPTVIKD